MALPAARSYAPLFGGTLPVMSQAFHAQPKSMGELLTGIDKPKLLVPQFQRGYSWEKKHVQAFWNDLMQFQQEKRDGVSKKYFLGPIVVLAKVHDEAEVIEVLDGQQRIATVTILFAAIRDAARAIGTTEADRFAHAIHSTFIAKDDAGDHLGYSLELGALDKLFFIEYIQDYTPTKSSTTLRSHRNIASAALLLRTSLAGQLSGLAPSKQIEYLKSLRNALRSDLIVTCIPVEREEEAFRIFETLNDRGLRLSVPDLLLNYLMRVAPENDRGDIRSYWNQMTERMGRRNISTFLRHIWVSRFGDVKYGLFSEIKKYIEDNHVVSLDYARACSEDSNNYCALLDFDAVRLKNSRRHVQSLLGPLGCKAALPLLLSAYTTLESADFEKLAKQIVVFVVRYSVLARMDSTGMENLLFALARQVREQMESGSVTGSKCVATVKRELVKQAPSDEKVSASLGELTLTSSEAGYVVGRLAQAMQTATKELGLNEANVEHIFPRNPLRKEWPNADTLEPHLWHIGNLIMLGERINAAVANRGYSFKKERYAKTSELKIAHEVAADYEDWDEAAIQSRASKLGNHVLAIWNFANPSKV